jgi:hypothetical protein
MQQPDHTMVARVNATFEFAKVNATLRLHLSCQMKDLNFFLKNPAIRLRRCVYNDDGDETGAAKERNAAHSAGGK